MCRYAWSCGSDHLVIFQRSAARLWLPGPAVGVLAGSVVLALIVLLDGCVKQGCQFIVATHSPLLMAMPDATILLAEDGRLRPVQWDDLEHVRVTRAFMKDPAAIMRRLLEG